MDYCKVFHVTSAYTLKSDIFLFLIPNYKGMNAGNKALWLSHPLLASKYLYVIHIDHIYKYENKLLKKTLESQVHLALTSGVINFKLII